jgi:predicted Ser/Thr protein kinase
VGNLNFKRSIIGVATLLVGFLSVTGFAAEKSLNLPCDELLQSILAKMPAKEGNASLYVDQIIANDRPTFVDLINPDPKKNLFARAPLNAMGGAQRMKAMVLSQGVQRRKIGFLTEPVDVYPFFSDGGEATQGYRVEGNWKATSEVVMYMTAQAEGSRAGRAVPILFGPGSTGKSEFRTVLEKGAEVLTTTNPDYALYSFDWINLNQIREIVKRWGPDVDTIPAPRNKSPITILPPEFQNQALEMAAHKGREMLGGITPSINLKPDSWSRSILRYIIAQYTEEAGRPLTAQETLQVIAKHVRVRRFVMSAAYKQFPIVNVQGIDSDHTQLFVSSNPVVQAISPEGKMDPFAYSYSGLVFQGDGNVTVFEELTRSHESFMEKMMDALESREIQSAGGEKEPWDSFVVGVSNKESWDRLMSKGGLSALKQRLQQVEMLQPGQPQLIARTILYGVKESVFMKKIGDENAQWEKMDVDALFPIPEKLEPGHVYGPEKRFLVRIGEGDRAVEVSPHTLRFMAQIIAATRYETDKERAYQLVPTRLVHDNLFDDPIQRIRYWDGRLTDIQPEERRTLDEMTNKMGEGHNGIPHRNALRWLTKALNTVRQDERLGKTLTPSVMLKVFEDEGFREDGFIPVVDHQQAAQYKRFGRLVLKELLVPQVREDINLAYSAEQGQMSDVYQDVLDELMEDHRTKGAAASYTSNRTNREMRINKERVAFIKDHYKRQHGRDLPMDQVLFFHMNQMKDGNRKFEPSPEIVGALSAFMAKKTLEAANATGLGEALRSGNGSKETLDLVNNLVKHLEKLGYNRVAALDAFDLEHLASQPGETVSGN